MARGDTAPPARRHFGDDEGEGAPSKPRRLSYPCLAHGCPMPGSIFLNGHDAPGICAMHLNSNADTMPRITEVLTNWRCVAVTLETVRRFLTDPLTCTDVKGEKRLLDAQWRELALMAPDWPQLAPQPKCTLSDWSRKLNAFLVWRLNCDLGKRSPEWHWPQVDTNTVAAMKRAIAEGKKFTTQEPA